MVDLVGRFSNPRAREWRVGASSVEDDVIPNRSDRGARWRPQHRLTEDQIDQIADAYLEAWTDVADRATLRRQAQLAIRVGPLTRSMSYVNALAGVDDAAWDDDADAIPGWLLELLEPGLPLHAPLL